MKKWFVFIITLICVAISFVVFSCMNNRELSPEEKVQDCVKVFNENRQTFERVKTYLYDKFYNDSDTYDKGYMIWIDLSIIEYDQFYITKYIHKIKTASSDDFRQSEQINISSNVNDDLKKLKEIGIKYISVLFGSGLNYDDRSKKYYTIRFENYFIQSEPNAFSYGVAWTDASEIPDNFRYEKIQDEWYTYVQVH